MTFNSPEKSRNDDLFEMIHKLNDNRSAMVPANSNQNYFGLMHNSTINDNKKFSSNQQQLFTSHLNNSPVLSSTPSLYSVMSSSPNWQANYGSLFSSINAQHNHQMSNTNQFNTLLPSSQHNTDNMANIHSSTPPSSCNNSLMIGSGSNNGGSVPPPLPSRSPVLGINRISALVNQLTVAQSQETSSIASTNSTSKNKYKISDNKSAFVNSKTDKRKTNSSGDLIDLKSNMTDHNKTDDTSKTSILEYFDPLLIRDKMSDISSATHDQLLKYKTTGQERADDEVSYYEQQDPFEYMYAGTGSTRYDIKSFFYYKILIIILGINKLFYVLYNF